jgi:hypothetical protein
MHFIFILVGRNCLFLFIDNKTGVEAFITWACPFASLRVATLRASLRSVLRTLRPSRRLTQNLSHQGKPHKNSPCTIFCSVKNEKFNQMP